MGVSNREAKVYTLENVVDDAPAVLDVVGVGRPMVFVVCQGGTMFQGLPRHVSMIE